MPLMPVIGLDTHAIELFAAVFLAALVASTLSGVTGFGGGVVMVPVLIASYGIRSAVVILTITQAVGNASRAWFGREAIHWRVALRFIAAAIPAALFGSVLFATISLHWLTRLLGLFLIATVLYRHSRFGHSPRMTLAGFVPLGAAFGFLSAVLGSVGPFVAPWFLAFGLVKTAYVSTESVGALAMHVTKAIAYGKLSLMSYATLAYGLALSPAMIAGSYFGKTIASRVSGRAFEVLIEVALVVAGLLLVIRGAA